MSNSYENHKLQLGIETEEFQNSRGFLSNFPPKFKEMVKIIPRARAYYETLIRGGSPYIAIYELIKSLDKVEKQLLETQIKNMKWNE